MAEFRFRTQAALELRRQQETSAATTLTAAEAALRLAEARVEQAELDRRAAQDQQTVALRRGSDIGALAWHHNWVTRLGVSINLARGEVAERAAAVGEAEAVWREARRKRLALERMRERAVRRFLDDERRQEMKDIDELARLRFIMAEQPTDDAS